MTTVEGSGVKDYFQPTIFFWGQREKHVLC
uniref:Uncharacterized protein n=1 Tax=Rhizophora mucronata TaxID=61149 RepID=A0A2P2NTP1_RHIMU